MSLQFDTPQGGTEQSRLKTEDNNLFRLAYLLFQVILFLMLYALQRKYLKNLLTYDTEIFRPLTLRMKNTIGENRFIYAL